MSQKNGNTVWKVIGIIVGVIVVTITGAAIYAKMWWDDLTLKPDVQSLKSNILNIASSLLTNQTIPITVLVDNKNNIGITIRNFQIKGYYEGQQVFQTVLIPILQIPANAINHPLNGTIQVLANAKTAKLVSQVVQNAKPTIQLEVIGTRFNLSKTFDYTIA